MCSACCVWCNVRRVVRWFFQELKKKKNQKRPSCPSFFWHLRYFLTHVHFGPQLAHFLWLIDGSTFLLAFEVFSKTHAYFSLQLALFIWPIDSPFLLPINGSFSLAYSWSYYLGMWYCYKPMSILAHSWPHIIFDSCGIISNPSPFQPIVGFHSWPILP
jgi:hypothetical protein